MKSDAASKIVGAPRPAIKRGNPRWSDPEYQRAQAARRWCGHVSKAEWRRIDEGLERLAVEGAVAQARALMGGETVNSDEENWEPYEENDDQGEPVEPFYTERSLRERMERKAARKPRKDRTE